MNSIPEILKDQSRHLQRLVNRGENLEIELHELEAEGNQSNNIRLKKYYRWQIRVLSNLKPLLHLRNQDEILGEITSLSPTSESVAIITGIMEGILLDINKGQLNHLIHRIQKEGIEDLLTQADELLIDDSGEIKGYLLAGMCVGITLEYAVRKICERENIVPDNDKWKPLTQLIELLVAKEIFNEHLIANITVWKNIRNDVSHGKFDSFNRSDIEGMIEGVKRFVEDYL